MGLNTGNKPETPIPGCESSGGEGRSTPHAMKSEQNGCRHVHWCALPGKRAPLSTRTPYTPLPRRDGPQRRREVAPPRRCHHRRRSSHTREQSPTLARTAPPLCHTRRPFAERGRRAAARSALAKAGRHPAIGSGGHGERRPASREPARDRRTREAQAPARTLDSLQGRSQM